MNQRTNKPTPQARTCARSGAHTHTHTLFLSKQNLPIIRRMHPSVLFNSALGSLTTRRPVLVYAAAWTTLLTLTVAMASFTPEVAFVSVISSSGACHADGYVRVPLDLPGEIFCLPGHRFMRSKVDFLVPPIFAAVIVAASAFLVRAVALWETDVVHWVSFLLWLLLVVGLEGSLRRRSIKVGFFFGNFLIFFLNFYLGRY